MRCSICGRKLKNSKSKELGYGPVCYKKKFGSVLHTNPKSRNSSTGEMANYNLPGQMCMDDYLQMVSGE